MNNPTDPITCALCQKAPATLMLVPYSECYDTDEHQRRLFAEALPVCKVCDGAGVLEIFQLASNYEKVIVSDLWGRRISATPKKIVDRKEISPWWIRQKLALTQSDSGFRMHPNSQGPFRKDGRHKISK